MLYFFFFKQKTAYEMRISDWSSDVCSSDLQQPALAAILIPFGEIIGVAAVLARTMMFEPDAAHLVGQREQEFIAVEMADAEQRDGFGHQRGVARAMVGARLQIFRLVGDDEIGRAHV